MSWKKWIPKELKKPFKAVGKVSQKILPKEIRPWLPMITPFLPAMGIMGPLGGPMGFAKMYGANLLTQQLADPDAEFDDLNQLAAILAGTQGGLTNTETAANLRGMTTQGKLSADPSLMTKEGIMKQMANAPVGSSTLADAANRSMLTKAKDLGLTGLAEASDYLTGTTKTLQDLGAGRGPVDLFSVEGAKALGKSAAVPASVGLGGVTEAFQRPVIRQFEKDKAAEEAEIEATTTANESDRAYWSMRFMREAGHDEEVVKETLEQNDLGEYYEPPVTAAQGGIIGLKNGGGTQMASYDYNDAMAEAFDAYERAIKDGIIPPTMEFDEYLELMQDSKKETAPQGVHMVAQGGIIGLKHGGMLNFGGREMDLRGGGFVPIGRKERADDVPARLSKNEFVMTADAVRAAGGGDVNKGAQRMYNVMNNLEARA